jgi:hypothetical protein
MVQAVLGLVEDDAGARLEDLVRYFEARGHARSPQTSLDSPIDTHTSVWMKSAPATASAGSSVMVIRAPVQGSGPC